MAYETIGIGTAANDGTGDDLRTGAGKINDNFAKALENNKIIIDASMMLPESSASGYYVAANDGLGYMVFIHTATTGVQAFLFDIGNQIHADADQFKFKIVARQSGGDEANNNTTCWKVRAGYIDDGDESITYGTAVYLNLDLPTAGKIATSAQSGAVGFGTRGNDGKMVFEISRDVEYDTSVDDLAYLAQLLWVEIEFSTAA